MIEIARTLPPHVKYELPSPHKVGGCLLDDVTEVCWEKSIKNVLKEVLIFGCTVMADGATINLTPLYTIIASSPNNMMAILDIIDLSLQSAAGEKKTGTLLADLMAPLIERFEGLVDRNSVNHCRLVDFCAVDGASNVQMCGAILSTKFPGMTCVHGAEHATNLVFNDLYTLIPEYKQISKLTKKLRNVFGTTRHAPTAMFGIQCRKWNKGVQLGMIKPSDCRLVNIPKK